MDKRGEGRWCGGGRSLDFRVSYWPLVPPLQASRYRQRTLQQTDSIFSCLKESLPLFVAILTADSVTFLPGQCLEQGWVSYACNQYNLLTLH